MMHNILLVTCIIAALGKHFHRRNIMVRSMIRQTPKPIIPEIENLNWNEGEVEWDFKEESEEDSYKISYVSPIISSVIPQEENRRIMWNLLEDLRENNDYILQIDTILQVTMFIQCKNGVYTELEEFRKGDIIDKTIKKMEL